MNIKEKNKISWSLIFQIKPFLTFLLSFSLFSLSLHSWTQTHAYTFLKNGVTWVLVLLRRTLCNDDNVLCLHCSVRQPLANFGYWALGMWLVELSFKVNLELFIFILAATCWWLACWRMQEHTVGYLLYHLQLLLSVTNKRKKYSSDLDTIKWFSVSQISPKVGLKSWMVYQCPCLSYFLVCGLYSQDHNPR